MRDTQRSRLYASERATANVLELEHGFEYGWGSAPMTPAECQAYINKVTASQWFRTRYGRAGNVTIKHVPQAKRGGADDYRGEIRTAGRNPKSRTTRYLLHELAHLLDGTHEASHGPTFCMIYLELVRHFLGKQTHDVLKAQMKALKLRVKPKATRAPRAPLSEEQKDALRERLAKARETKRIKTLLHRAEIEHGRRLCEYTLAYRASQREDYPDTLREYYAKEAERLREDTNRLWDKIGTVKYSLVKR